MEGSDELRHIVMLGNDMVPDFKDFIGDFKKKHGKGVIKVKYFKRSNGTKVYIDSKDASVKNTFMSELEDLPLAPKAAGKPAFKKDLLELLNSKGMTHFYVKDMDLHLMHVAGNKRKNRWYDINSIGVVWEIDGTAPLIAQLTLDKRGRENKSMKAIEWVESLVTQMDNRKRLDDKMIEKYLKQIASKLK
jgi:hypothetical protein